MLLLAVFISISAFAQTPKKSVEVLYFKADLACCRARACNALQADIDAVLTKYFAEQNILFKAIRIADPANQELVTQYNAKAQSVLIIKTNRKKQTAIDLTSIVHQYSIDHDKAMFEDQLKAKINEIL